MQLLFPLVSALACGSTFFIAFLLFTRRPDANSTANFWLAFFLLAVGVLMLDDCLLSFRIYHAFPSLIGFADPVIYLLAPTFYLSVYFFTSPKARFDRWHWMHFLPFIMMLFIESSFILQPGAEKLVVINHEVQNKSNRPTIFFAFLALVMMSIAAYLALSLKQLINHQRNVRLFSASVESINLSWLLYLLYGVLLMFLIWAGSLLFQFDFFIATESWAYFIIIYFIGYHAMRQPAVFPFSEQEKQSIADIIQEDTISSAASKRPMFSSESLQVLKTNLLHLMENEKPYLDNELNLPKLARIMQLSTHEMSYLLNEGFQENFFQFINRYRIEESKRLLSDSDMMARHSMVGIAFEAGFNSKTTFNTTFKRATGLSPSAFQKQARAGKIS